MAIGIVGNDKSNRLLDLDKKNKYGDKTYIPKLSNENDAHAYICKEVKPKTTVLDIGCAQGFIGKILKGELNCKVYGIELDTEAYKISKSSGNYEDVFSFDISDEKSTNYKDFMKKNIEFDYILFSDVLEHLINPQAVLFRFASKLKYGGSVLVSLPNVSHYDIIEGLFNEKFNYSDMGLLDNTHLRFFTKYSFAEYIDTANKVYDFKLDLKLVNNTIAYPSFYGKYKHIEKMISDKNKDLYILQNIFQLKKIKKEENTVELNKILKENRINLLENIDERIDNLINEVNQLKNENKKLANESVKLRDDLDYMINEYNKVIYSRSWKITKPLRDYKDKKNEKILKKNSSSDYKQSILCLVHSWINVYDKNITNIGGTTNHVLDVINGLKDKINFYVLTVINNKYMLVTFENGFQQIYDLNVSVSITNYDGYDYKFNLLINTLIDKLKIDLVHIHHILNFPCDLEYINPKVKKIFTVHDFSSICARYFLLDYKNKYCEDRTCEKCKKCTDNKINIEVRNKAIENLIHSIDFTIVPDESVKNELEKYISMPNCITIPHGVDFSNYQAFKINNQKNKSKYKNIAFVGFIDNHKGSKFMKELIENNNDPYIKYHLFGSANIEISNNSNYIDHGKYNKNELPKLLNDNQIDLVLLLSTCFESFSYVLSEVTYAQIPCLAFDIGAIASRIKKDNIGWIIDRKSTYSNIIATYEKIFEEEEYEEKIKNIKNYHFNTTNEMINKLNNTYEKLYEKNLKDYYYITKELNNYYLKYKI